MTVSTALSGGNVTSLRKSGHRVKGYLYAPPMETVATMRINQVVFEKPLAAIEVDGATGFADIQPGMTYWIGTTAGARDVHVGRIRGTVTNFILVEEFTSGDPGMLPLSELKSLANDLHITVKKDYNLHSVFPRISYSGGVNARVGTFYKDFNVAYMDQNATIPAGILRIGQHRVSTTTPASFDFAAFTDNWAVGTVDTYAWDFDGGSVTAGADDEQFATVEFTTGFYVVSCTVVLTTGAEITARRFVWVNQAAIPVTVNSDTRDISGRRMSFTTYSDLETLPDGAMCVWHEQASWGGDTIAEATTQFVGFVRTIEPRQENGILRRSFEMASPMIVAQDLVAFSQELTKNSDPQNWQEAIHLLMHLPYWVFYLLYYHSTLPLLFDIEFDGNLIDYLTQAWSVQAGSLGGAVAESGSRLNCTVGQDSRGTIFIKRDPQFMSSDDRDDLIERMTITEADIRMDTLNWGTMNVRNRVGRVEASGFAYDGTELAPYLAAAPGFVGGQGAGTAQLQNQLLYAFGDPQAELNQRAACALAKENNPHADISFTLLGNYDVFEPAERYWARLQISAANTPDGVAFNKRILFKTLSKRRLAGGAVEIDATVEAEVYADAAQGQTIPIMPDATYNAGVLDGNSYSILPTINSAGLLDFPYNPFSIPNYSYPPVAYAQATDTTTGYVLAWSDERLYNSANTGSTWGELYEPTDVIVDFVHDPNSTWLTDSVTGALRGWLLTDAGLEYNADMLAGGSWALKEAIAGGKFLRAPAGVPDGISVYVNEQDITFTFDFTVSDWGFEAILDVEGTPNAVYTPGVGWEDVLVNLPSGFYRVCAIRKQIHGSGTITNMTVDYSMTAGDIEPDTGNINGIAVYNPGFNDLYSNPVEDSTPDPMTWSGTEDLAPDDYLFTQLIAGIKIGSDPGGTITITSMSITFDGDNFCGVGQLIYSDDTGDTVSTTEIDGSGDHANGCFDVDDFGLGVLIVSNGDGITYTETYTDAATTLLTGLTGLDGDAVVTCIRIPLKKLLTQADNDDATSLQFIYGTDSAVSGKTLWAVTFDATDGSISAQVDITPIISGVTYCVVGTNALETAGADTRIILAFARPVAGGDAKLIRTANGADSWGVANSINGTHVRWVPGSTQRAWMNPGARYTTNRGSTLQNKTTGITGDVLGLQGF